MSRRIAAEFSRPIPVSSLAEGENVFAIEAAANERQSLAKRLNLASLGKLTARIGLTPRDDGAMVVLRGALVAEATQTCVVTLEPLRTRIEAPFERMYGQVPFEEPPGEVIMHPDLEDLSEPFVDGAIDIGESATEQLALELDPFPRMPGVSFEGLSGEKTSSEAPRDAAGPFGELASLKEKLERKA